MPSACRPQGPAAPDDGAAGPSAARAAPGQAWTCRRATDVYSLRWREATLIIAIMTGSLSSPIVVGRATELAAIDAALQRSIEGTASVVLIGGDAGMGKTRLIQAAAHRSREAGAGC